MTSHSSAKRSTLESNVLSPLFIAVFVLTIGWLSFLVYPRQLTTEILVLNQPEPLTQIYLKALVDQFPNDIDYKVALTEQAIGMHQYKKADQLLQELAHIEAAKDQITRLQFLYTFNKTFQLPISNQRNKAFTVLMKLFPTLIDLQLTTHQFQQLGNIALKLKLPQYALICFEKVVKSTHHIQPDFYRQIAKTALASSQYRISAYYYFQASRIEPIIELKRRDLINGLKAYQSGNLMSEGIQQFKEIPKNLLNNDDMLLFLTQYAIAAGRPDIADQYIKRALFDSAGAS